MSKVIIEHISSLKLLFLSFSSYSANQTIIDRCSTINAYRYVTRAYPNSTRKHSLYRNEYCLICHNVTHSPDSCDITCEHALEDELLIDPNPITGSRGVYRFSILFDPNTFSIQIPAPSLSHHQYHSSYQTHFTTIYPCRDFEVYDYLLHTCIKLHDEDDRRLTRSFNCTNPILIRNEILKNNSIRFFSHQLYRQHGDFIVLFSDSTKFIIRGERFPLLYIHHNRFITTIRYSSTYISLLSLLIFMISFVQKSTLHNLPGKCLLMFSISLQFSQSTFLVSGHLLEHSNRFWCICSGIAVHFFYLSTFAWLSAISFDTCLALTQMNRLDVRVARNRFIFYNIFVWFVSLTIVSISVCLHSSLAENNPWSPNYGGILCSISSRYALITFFLVPVGISVLSNFIIFARTIFVIRRTDRETRLARCTGGNDRSRAFLYFRLAILMGIHWLFLVICIVFRQDILWLLFDLINSLPGLFIAINFLRKQTSLKDIKAKIRSSQSQLSSLGTGSNSVSTANHIRGTYTGVDASANVQMSRKLDAITQKLDKLTRHLLKPNEVVSTSSFHSSASSL